jgi:hypothetical protein
MKGRRTVVGELSGFSFMITLFPSLNCVSERRMPEEEPEDVIVDVQRMRMRILDAVNDPSGRKKLFLNGLSCPSFDDTIGRIIGLEQLFAYHCPLLRSIPASFASLRDSMRVIDLHGCHLESLPEDLSDFIHLEFLDVSHNVLTSFVWDVSKWRQLKFLNCAFNRLRYFSPTFSGVLSRLKAIEASAKRVQLFPQPSWVFLPNDHFFTPTERLSQPTMSPKDEQEALRQLLPPSVERCTVCERLLHYSPLVPVVYVQFVVWAQFDPDAFQANRTREIQERAAAQEGEGAVVGLKGELDTPSEPSKMSEGVTDERRRRVPLLHSLCDSVECHKRLHQQLHETFPSW